MKKDLIKLFLSLSILLLSGCLQLHAYTYAGDGKSFSKRTSESLNISLPDLNHEATIHRVPDHNREVLKIDVVEIRKEEEDEDKLTSLKKRLKSTILLATIAFAHALNYFFNSGKAHAFYRDCSFTLPYRYLLIRVFRI